MTNSFKHCLMAGAVSVAAVLFAGQAMAAVSAEEAAKLGRELPEFGAIKAGNADGTIPEYTGGYRNPNGKDMTAHRYPNPFTEDKPRLRIDASNVDQHADKLSAGHIHQIKTIPGFYIDVFPTRRTSWYPDRIIEATKRNATTCTAPKDEIAIDVACRGGIPFPIPTTGNQLMWNKVLSYGQPTITRGRHYMVTTTGEKIMAAELDSYAERSYYNPDRDPMLMAQQYGIIISPSRKAGEASGRIDFMDPTTNPRRGWAYSAGQRRVRMAPEFTYDTPISTTGGILLYDETFIFDGAMDRFDFKLMGKKEMYIPANNFDLFDSAHKCAQNEELGPKAVNPECVRYELRRVWHVQATLKQGMRHAYAKRDYFIDEDSYVGGTYDGYDASGRLARSGNQYSIPFYDLGGTSNSRFAIFDLVKGMYTLQSQPQPGTGYQVTTMPQRDLSPESIAGRASR